MTSDRELGVGVIGCGGIANFAHIPSYLRHARSRVVAVADIDPAKARDTAERWGIGSWYQDYRELLARPDVEAVSVTTWPAAHASEVVAAARAGKHVLCEKPIATELEDADAMVEEADRAGVKLMIGYQHRFGSVWPRVERLLEEETIGRVMALSIVSCAPSSHSAPWFLQKRYSGGGVLMDWGIYTAYTINWLFGPVESVCAESATFRPNVRVRDTLLEGLDVEDTVAAVLRFRSGAMGTWYSCWAGRASHGYTSVDGLDGSMVVSQGDRRGISLYSTRLGDPEHLGGWRVLPVVEPPLSEVHYRKIAHFVDCVLDDAPLAVTGADGRDALELVLAIYRSAESGAPVRLPLARIPAAARQPEGKG